MSNADLVAALAALFSNVHHHSTECATAELYGTDCVMTAIKLCTFYQKPEGLSSLLTITGILTGQSDLVLVVDCAGCGHHTSVTTALQTFATSSSKSCVVLIMPGTYHGRYELAANRMTRFHGVTMGDSSDPPVLIADMSDASTDKQLSHIIAANSGTQLTISNVKLQLHYPFPAGSQAHCLYLPKQQPVMPRYHTAIS